MLILFVTTTLVLCASLFALSAVAPLMLEKRRKHDVPDNLVSFPRSGQAPDDLDRPAA